MQLQGIERKKKVVLLRRKQLYFAVAIELYLLCRNFHAALALREQCLQGELFSEFLRGAEHCIDFGLHFEIYYPRFPS